MFWCTECSFWQTLTITNDTKLDCTSYRLVQSSSYCYFTYFIKLLDPRGRNAADQAYQRRRFGVSHWPVSVLHQPPTNVKPVNYVKNEPKILKQKKMNDSWLDESERYSGQKERKKPLLPFARLHRWLLSSRDIRKHHSSTSFDWLRIKLRLEVESFKRTVPL